MSFLAILAFVGTLFIFVASPGPGTFAVIARALGSEFKNAFFMSIGMAFGDLTFLLLAVFGLSAMANILGDVFVVVKYLGGLYLIYLGIKIYISKPVNVNITLIKNESIIRDFISGYLIAVSNPKVIFFYLGFLPTFVNLETLRVEDIVIISILVMLVLIFTLGIYAYFASKARKSIKSIKTQTIMNRFAGTVMVAAGATLIAKS